MLAGQPRAPAAATAQHTYHAHQQLVEPLQFELGLGPHVRSQGRLQEGHTPARQHLPRGASSVGVVVNLEIHSNSSPQFSADVFIVTLVTLLLPMVHALASQLSTSRPPPLPPESTQPSVSGTLSHATLCSHAGGQW